MAFIVSTKKIVTSVVPQGSHLGRILFLLFINGMIQIFYDICVLLFAGDIIIYKEFQ